VYRTCSTNSARTLSSERHLVRFPWSARPQTDITYWKSGQLINEHCAGISLSFVRRRIRLAVYSGIPTRPLPFACPEDHKNGSSWPCSFWLRCIGILIWFHFGLGQLLHQDEEPWTKDQGHGGPTSWPRFNCILSGQQLIIYENKKCKSARKSWQSF